jgi:hypothetical protein
MRILTAEDIDLEDYDNETIYCPACLDRGYTNAIGSKILMPNEPRPDNYEDLWECAVCSLNGDASQIAKEAEIKDAIELQESSEDNRTVIESINKREFKTGKPLIKRGNKRRQKKQLHHDIDVALAIKQHGEDNIRVQYDSTQ